MTTYTEIPTDPLLNESGQLPWASSLLALLPLAYPLGLFFRRVVVAGGVVAETRFPGWHVRYLRTSIDAVMFADSDVGWGFLPASKVSLRVAGTDRVLPTQTSWALTARQRERSRGSAERLAGALDVPFLTLEG
jgi:hypothetical protein